jgi:transcriptional regulator with XRE-family HTH domain
MVWGTSLCRIKRIAVIYQFLEKYQRKAGMSRRGRKQAPTDEAAHEARRSIVHYLENHGLSLAELARRAGVSGSAAWRVLNESPPRWSPTFIKLHEFVKSEQAPRDRAPDRAEGLVRRLAQVAGRGGNPSSTTAALLRVVADLLDSTAPTGHDPKR